MTGGRGLVDLVCSHGVARIRLNRPERLNAFNEALHGELASALDDAMRNDACRAIVLSGSGRAFSTGQDLQERAAAFQAGTVPDLHRSIDVFYNPLIRRIARCEKPVIAEVCGIAFGAGAALALACDIVLAARSASFQFGFAKVALGPDSGVSWLLPRACGTARALDLLLTGRRVDAEEALALGLISRLVADDGLAEETDATARAIADTPAAAVASIKRLVRGGADLTLDQALDAERDNQARLGLLPAYREAVLAFSEKRKRDA